MSKFVQQRKMNSFMRTVIHNKPSFQTIEEESPLIKQDSVKNLIKKFEIVNKIHEDIVFDEVTIDNYVSDDEKPVKTKSNFIDKLKRFKNVKPL